MYVCMYTVGHKVWYIFFSTLLWNISCCGRYLRCLGCLPLYAESTNLFLAYSHKISNIKLLQDVYLALNEKEPLEQQNWGFCLKLFISVNFKNNSVFGDFTAS